MKQLLGVISSILFIIIGLWKFFTSKARKKQKLRDEAYNEGKEAIKKGDVSRITSVFDRFRRLR